jgi:hypothetical protein
MELNYAERELRVLDFDIEAQPGAWFGGDFVTKRVLAIACAWVVDGEATEVECRTRYGGKGTTLKMLKWFLTKYNEADVVTGHFIRGYDLPGLQGALIRYQLPLLGQKMTQDTKLDMVKATGISKSQENLGALYELEHPKVIMNVPLWEEAGDLTREGLERVKERCAGDVLQHVELREKMLACGSLGDGKVWTPKGNGSTSKYAP